MRTVSFRGCICFLLFILLQGCEDYEATYRKELEKQKLLLREKRRLTSELASIRYDLEPVMAERRNHAEMLKQLQALAEKDVWSFLSTERNGFVFYLMILWPFLACAGCWIVWRIV